MTHLFGDLYLVLASMSHIWSMNNIPGSQEKNSPLEKLVAHVTFYRFRKGYQKFKRAFIRKAGHGEKIQTILQGKIETENIANEGDMVVRADTTSKEEPASSNGP